MKRIILVLFTTIALLLSSVMVVSASEKETKDIVEGTYTLSTGTKVKFEYDDSYGFDLPKYDITGLTDQEIDEVVEHMNLENKEIQKSLKSNNNGEWRTKSFYNGNLIEYYNPHRLLVHTARTTSGGVYYAYTIPMHFFKYKGEVAYCVEADLGVSGSGWTVNTTGSGSNYNDLSNKQQKLISDYVAYGSARAEEYRKSGATTYDYRMFYVATQILIWQVTNDFVIKSGTDWASNNPNTSIQAYMNGVTGYMTRNKKYPSFARLDKTDTTTPVYTLNWNASTGQYEVILTDKNGVWDKNYSWYGNISGFTFSNPSGANNVKISTKYLEPYTNTKVFNKSNISRFHYDPYPYGSDPKFLNGWGSGGSKNQDIIQGLSDPINIKFGIKVNKVSNGKIEVTKNNQNGEPLAGVRFDLYDLDKNKYITTCTTNSSGKCYFNNLNLGRYRVYEKSASDPDIIVNGTDYWSVNVYSSSTRYINVTNNEISGDVKIKKVNQNNISLSGVKFGLYKSDNTYLKSCTTNSSGMCYFNDLSGGSYYVKELSATDPDIVISNMKYSFTINKPSQIVNINNDKVVNQQYASLLVDELYVEMGNDELGVNITTKSGTDDYIDPQRSKVKVVLYEDGVRISEKTINLLEGWDLVYSTHQWNFSMPIPVVDHDTSLRVEIENMNGSKYPVQGANIERYASSNNSITKDTPDGSLGKNDGLKPVYSRYDYYANPKYQYAYESISWDGFDYQTIEDGLLEINGSYSLSIPTKLDGMYDLSSVYSRAFHGINESVLFDSNYQVLDKYNPTVTMFQPLEDITMMYDTKNGHTYKMNYDNDRKLYLDDIVMESYNGRIYDVNTELYNNATSERDLLKQGYRDIHDNMIEIEDIVPLPVYNTFDMQGKEYVYYTLFEDLGVNQVDLKVNSKFLFDKKKFSTKEEYGSIQIDLENVSDEEFEQATSGENELYSIELDGSLNVRDIMNEENCIYYSDLIKYEIFESEEK